MKHCLVVDDSAAIRTVIRGILEDLRFEVSEASNGLEALDLCRKRMPDVVLLDWNMPVMDGLEFLGVLRAQAAGQQAKVIFCSTVRDAEQIVQAMIAGASEYLVKPFDRPLLEAKFQEVGVM